MADSTEVPRQGGNVAPAGTSDEAIRNAALQDCATVVQSQTFILPEDLSIASKAEKITKEIPLALNRLGPIGMAVAPFAQQAAADAWAAHKRHGLMTDMDGLEDKLVRGNATFEDENKLAASAISLGEHVRSQDIVGAAQALKLMGAKLQDRENELARGYEAAQDGHIKDLTILSGIKPESDKASSSQHTAPSTSADPQDFPLQGEAHGKVMSAAMGAGAFVLRAATTDLTLRSAEHKDTSPFVTTLDERVGEMERMTAGLSPEQKSAYEARFIDKVTKEGDKASGNDLKLAGELLYDQLLEVKRKSESLDIVAKQLKGYGACEDIHNKVGDDAIVQNLRGQNSDTDFREWERVHAMAELAKTLPKTSPVSAPVDEYHFTAADFTPTEGPLPASTPAQQPKGKAASVSDAPLR